MDQENPLIPTSLNTAQPAPSSCCQTNVTIEEVDDEDAVPVTPIHSHHVTFAEILFSTPSSEDVLFRGQSSWPSTPLQPESPEHEDYNDVFQSLGSSTRSAPSPLPSTPTPSHHNHGQQNHSPRAGPHSTRRSSHASGPAGNRLGHKAKDVFMFFTKEDKRYYCMFCK